MPQLHQRVHHTAPLRASMQAENEARQREGDTAGEQHLLSKLLSWLVDAFLPCWCAQICFGPSYDMP